MREVPARPEARASDFASLILPLGFRPSFAACHVVFVTMALVSSIAADRGDPDTVTHPKFLPRKKRKTGRIALLVAVLALGAGGAVLYLRPPAVTTAPVI